MKLVLLCIVLASCGERSATERETEPVVAEAEAEPAEAEPVAERQDQCASLRARAAAILETPSAACQSDDECRCYPAFIDCGGVRDVASAGAFSEVAQLGREADCGYHNTRGEQFNCAPWQCTPVCRNDNCTTQ